MKFQNSDNVKVNHYEKDGKISFSTFGSEEKIRIIIPLEHYLNKSYACNISINFFLQIEKGLITHASIVTSDVSEGRIIEIYGDTGFSEDIVLSGVFSSPQSEMILIISTQGECSGEISIKEPEISSFDQLPTKDHSLNILFYIEPWIEQDNAFWKQDYIWWFGNQANVLKETKGFDYNCLFITGESLASKFKEITTFDGDNRIISNDKLLKLFSSSQSALSMWMNFNSIKNNSNTFEKEMMLQMAKLVETELSGFEPDVIFTITPVPYLEYLFPNSLILHKNALYAREPWPELHIYDPKAFMSDAAIRKKNWQNAVYDIDACQLLIKQHSEMMLDDIQKHNPFEEKIFEIRKKYTKIILLSLQEIQYVSFYAFLSDKTQISYISKCIEYFSHDTAIIVTQHPACPTLDHNTMEWMSQKYTNLFHFSSYNLNITHSPSQYLIPLTDALITLSSGLAFQALMWKKRVFLSGQTYLLHLPNCLPLNADTKDNCDLIIEEQKDCDTFLYWLLTYYVFGNSFLLKENWLHDRILTMLNRKRSGEELQDLSARVAHDFEKLQFLKREKRIIKSSRPIEDKTLSKTERIKYEKTYTLAEYNHAAHLISYSDIQKLVNYFKIKPGQSVTDIGCGNGHIAVWLLKNNFKAIGLDIAFNCLDDTNKGLFPFLYCSIWEANHLFKSDYFHCVDVMEHIPTEKVDETLRVIAHNVCRGGIFTICLRPDGLGKLIGETLHLTVQDKDWWKARLKKQWKIVHTIKYDDVDPHATFIVSHHYMPFIVNYLTKKHDFHDWLLFHKLKSGLRKYLPAKIKKQIKKLLA